MSVWLTHMLLKNKGVYRQLPPRICLCYKPFPLVMVCNNILDLRSAFHQLHQGFHSTLLLSRHMFPVEITCLWLYQPGFGYLLQTTINYLHMDTRTPGDAFLHPASWTPGLPPLELLQLKGRRGRGCSAPTPEAITGTHPRGWPLVTWPPTPGWNVVFIPSGSGVP